MNNSGLGKWLGAATICGGALLMGACSADAGDTAAGEEPTVAEQSEALARVPAAGSGAKLGVLEWQFGTSLVRAIDTDDAVLAEFEIDHEGGKILSKLPNGGFRSIANPSESTLSELSAQLLEALRSDLDVQLDSSPSASPATEGPEEVDKATYYVYTCYHLLADCRVKSTYGLLSGWWSYSECVYPVWQCSNPYYRFALRYIP